MFKEISKDKSVALLQMLVGVVCVVFSIPITAMLMLVDLNAKAQEGVSGTLLLLISWGGILIATGYRLLKEDS